MKKFLLFLLLPLCLFVAQSPAAPLPDGCEQAVVGAADGWNSSHVVLSLLEKRGGRWQMVKGPFSGRLGEAGLVWGLGRHPLPKGATVKREGDDRSPAGVFDVGGIWATQSDLKFNRRIPFVKVGPSDLWVSDVKSPLYNRHVRLDHPARTSWELNEQMKLNDHAHSIKLLICHNTENVQGCPIPGRGSSIFFHIWRGAGKYPTAGCTTMSEENLRAVLAWLDPKKKPVYILMPRDEYMRYRSAWGLP